MPKVSKESATQGGDYGPVEDRSDELDGYTVGFTTFREDFDTTPLLKGLPEDRCQCAHWGYVIKGKVSFKTADGEETFETGDAYYVAPGHTPVLYAGTEIVEFSPDERAPADNGRRLEEHGGCLGLTFSGSPRRAREACTAAGTAGPGHAPPATVGWHRAGPLPTLNA